MIGCVSQGAFYILSQPLVEHLYRGHEHLECFTNEDVTIGSWLLGVSAHERASTGTRGHSNEAPPQKGCVIFDGVDVFLDEVHYWLVYAEIGV